MTQLIYAHRGASGYAPENTLEAFGLAIKMGADGIELDVHMTKDGQLVVCHDETIDRTSNGEGLIVEKTLKELKTYHFFKTHPEYEKATIPTLEEVFGLLKPTGLGINIELKNSYIDYPDLEKMTVELAAKMGMTERVVYSSFNHFSMMRLKQMDTSITCGLLYEATLVKPWAYAVALEMDALHPHFSEPLFSKEECAMAHKLGLKVNVWTPNTRHEIDDVLKAGVDMVITNYPDVAIERRAAL